MRWAVILVFTSTFAHADIQFPYQDPKDLFARIIKKIEPSVERVRKLQTPEERISEIDYIRSNLTDLQNIIRLYGGSKKFKSLKPFYEKVKSLEDHISHYGDDKYFASETANSGNEELRNKYRALLEKETKEYKQYVMESDWFKEDGSLIQQLRETLNQIEWPSLEKNRNFLLDQFAHRMRKQHSEMNDMADVELGIHESKRDARRFRYINDSIDDLVQSSNNLACPLGTDPQETERQELTDYYCKVSYCLTSKLTSAESSLQSLKSEGISYELRGEKVPENLVKQAQSIVDDLKTSKVYLHLANQLKACRSRSEK